MARRTRRNDDSVAKAAHMAGEMAGKSVALAEDAARRGLIAAKRVSNAASRDFLAGFKRGRGRRKEIR